MSEIDATTKDHLRKVRRLVDSLEFELDEKNYDKKNSPNWIHAIAWEIVTITRPEDVANESKPDT